MQNHPELARIAEGLATLPQRVLDGIVGMMDGTDRAANLGRVVAMLAGVSDGYIERLADRLEHRHTGETETPLHLVTDGDDGEDNR